MILRVRDPSGSGSWWVAAKVIGNHEYAAKKKMMNKRSMSMSMASLTLLLLLAMLSLSNAIDDKCAACKAVAEELEIGLSSEKPRNHLDMRHRLDSKGQRQGKLIDYRVSELRVVELLDDLCEHMQDYTINKDTNAWFKVHSWNNLSNKQEAKAYAKDISTYCGRLLEQTEDELAELIKKGSVKVGGVSKVLCQDLSKHCIQMSVSQEAEVDDDEDDGEL